MRGLGRGLGAAALLGLASVPGALGELDACLSALAQLLAPPYNASLPFMNGVSGKEALGEGRRGIRREDG